MAYRHRLRRGAPRRHALGLCALIALHPIASAAADPVPEGPGRGWAYLGGAAGEDTDAIKLGMRVHTPWAYAPFGLVAEVHVEFEVGRWRASRPASASRSPESDQYSVVPVLRLRRTAGARRYVEIGIGPSWITPLYRDADREFSTRFQFRDHVAVGWSLGTDRRHEVSLHVEHFSNAGVASPNPGVDLFGIRYARSF